MAILEIAVPTLFGAMLANAWHRYETLKPDYEWARELAHRMITENRPMEAWIHEALVLQDRKRNLEQQIEDWTRALHEADAQRKWSEVKRLQEQIDRAREEIRVVENRIHEVEKWYPGEPDEIRRRVNETP
jgi:chromosome segregation ATPase